jgi:hypothetical protein
LAAVLHYLQGGIQKAQQVVLWTWADLWPYVTDRAAVLRLGAAAVPVMLAVL